MSELQNLRINIEDFRKWLEERGYDNLMHEENLRLFLNIGLAGLFFSGSSLLLHYIFTKLGLPSERVSPKVRIELGRRVKEIKASKDHLEIIF
jgi:hypothetical protein